MQRADEAGVISLRLIVTGTGRSGTGFAARYLTSIGIPCGHESLFTPLGYGQLLYHLRQGKPGLVADSAWEAAPYLRLKELELVPVVQVVRHPRRVMESLVRVPPSTTPVYDEFCRVHFPALYGWANEVDRAAQRVVSITERIETLRPGRYVWRIEDGTDGLVQHLAALGFEVDTGAPFDNNRHNHKAGEPVEVALSDIADGLRDQVLALCERYGYEW